MSREFMGVILAAGKATRIHPLNQEMPKPLLPVGNRPLAVHQIEAMKQIGIEDIVVVVSQPDKEVVQCLGDGHDLGVRISYALQPEQLGIAHALACARDLLDRPFVLFLGDIYSAYASPEGLKPLVDRMGQPTTAGVLTVKEEPDEDVIRRNFTVSTQGDVVTKVVEKPKGPLDTNLRGCGIYLFAPSFFESVDRTPRSEVRDEYEITDAIQLFVETEVALGYVTLIDWDVNMTFPQDLLECNLHYLQWTGADTLVADSARLHPQCKVTNSVIGDDVVVEYPIAITDSLILAGAHITDDEDITQTVVGPETRIQCTLGD